MGKEIDINEKQRQISINVGNPKSNKKSTFFTETEGPRDKVAIYEIEGELLQIRKNKRKKESVE